MLCLGVFKRHLDKDRAQLARVAVLRDTELKRKALRELAETSLVYTLRHDMVSHNIIRTGVHAFNRLSCVFVQHGGQTVPVFCTDNTVDCNAGDALDALVLARVHNQTPPTRADTLSELRVCWPTGSERLHLIDSRHRQYPTRARAQNLLETLPGAHAAALQAAVDALGPTNTDHALWQQALQDTLQLHTKSRYHTRHILKQLRHALLAPGANTCFDQYHQAHSDALRFYFNLKAQSPLSEQFAQDLFRQTNALYTRALAQNGDPSPTITFAQQLRRTDSLLHSYLRAHAELQKAH